MAISGINLTGLNSNPAQAGLTTGAKPGQTVDPNMLMQIMQMIMQLQQGEMSPEQAQQAVEGMTGGMGGGGKAGGAAAARGAGDRMSPMAAADQAKEALGGARQLRDAFAGIMGGHHGHARRLLQNHQPG